MKNKPLVLVCNEDATDQRLRRFFNKIKIITILLPRPATDILLATSMQLTL